MFIDWGDGTFEDWDGPFLSYETQIRSHIWSESGTYNITAIAHIINGSTYYATLQVTILENNPPPAGSSF